LFISRNVGFLLILLQAKLASRRRQKRGFSFLVRFFFFRQDKKEK